jgi:hypothetical protein
MSTENTAKPGINPVTLRVRRHRERRREKLRLITIPVPEPVIDNAIARGLLKLADRAQPWAVIEGCYAVQLSDAALDWLVGGGVIRPEQRGDAAAILRAISHWLERAASA